MNKPSASQARTLEYYNTLWNKRKGISGTPNAFKLLPLPLQKEVTLDIFWEALRHSHLFTHTEMPFKRALSLEMKSEFFLTGDYVYRLGEIKNKMVYIVSGILQVTQWGHTTFFIFDHYVRNQSVRIDFCYMKLKILIFRS